MTTGSPSAAGPGHPVGISTPPVMLAQLAELHGGEVDRPARASIIARIAPLDAGGADDLCPFTSRRYAKEALASPALLLVDAGLAGLVPIGRRWVHPHAAWALAGILAELERGAAAPEPFAAPVVASDASVAAGVVIMAGAQIGPACVVEPNAVIYPRVVLGARVLVGACAVLGRPGFGWAMGPGGNQRRIPQLGGVRVDDDVEIGPLVTVDAGTLAPTVVGRGARLDAHVHVGHNVEVGPAAMVAAQSGFAGSVKVGAGARIGGQVGIADHVRVGAGAQIAAKSGVIGDIRESSVVAGYPATDRGRWFRGMARMLRVSGKPK